MARWLAEHPNNVAAVHCKAGKGRTGLMVCAYLLYSRRHLDAAAVLDLYASKRTFDCRGVTLPSQRRYVAYFAAKVARGLEYSPVKLLLEPVVLRPPPAMVFCHQHTGHLQLQLHQTLEPHHSSDVFNVDLTKKIVLKLPQPLLLNGDVKVVFVQKLSVVQDMLHLGARPRLVSTVKLCHFWVNTYFVALGLSCPLTHTVTEVRERRSSRSSRQEAGGSTGLRLLLD